jgi:hypothetical protein
VILARRDVEAELLGAVVDVLAEESRAQRAALVEAARDDYVGGELEGATATALRHRAAEVHAPCQPRK